MKRINFYPAEKDWMDYILLFPSNPWSDAFLLIQFPIGRRTLYLMFNHIGSPIFPR